MSILSYTFFQNALLGSLLASILCGLIGTYIVARRLVFISGGITHASFGGLGIAFWLGANPIGGALLFLFLPNKSPDQSGSGALVLFAVISVLYFIVMFTVLYFRSRAAKVKRDEAEYHSVYKK